MRWLFFCGLNTEMNQSDNDRLSDFGLKEVLGVIYAENVVSPIITGKNIALATRVHEIVHMT